MKRSYIDGPFGQVHILEWGSENQGAPILCLAPAPFTSAAYLTLAPLLGVKRRVIAIDYPGYGNSDATASEPTIADFADAVAAVATAVSPGQPVDLCGFHTGCLVAAETSLRHADPVNRLLLVDVPFFSSERQQKMLESMRTKPKIGTDLDGLQKAWNFCVVKKVEHIPLERAYQNFIDYIFEGDNANLAFYAAFGYPCEKQFSKLTHSTFVIATSTGLFDESREAAKAIEDSSLIEVPEITVAVLDKGAPLLAPTLLEITD